MLECGKNFKGTLSETCNRCNVLDDENHRLNVCPKFKQVNRCDHNDKVIFNNVYSNDISVIRSIIPEIDRVWNVKTAHGTMRK